MQGFWEVLRNSSSLKWKTRAKSLTYFPINFNQIDFLLQNIFSISSEIEKYRIKIGF
jgi:hypothetical protein